MLIRFWKRGRLHRRREKRSECGDWECVIEGLKIDGQAGTFSRLVAMHDWGCCECHGPK